MRTDICKRKREKRERERERERGVGDGERGKTEKNPVDCEMRKRCVRFAVVIEQTLEITSGA